MPVPRGTDRSYRQLGSGLRSACVDNLAARSVFRQGLGLAQKQLTRIVSLVTRPTDVLVSVAVIRNNIPSAPVAVKTDRTSLLVVFRVLADTGKVWNRHNPLSINFSRL